MRVNDPNLPYVQCDTCHEWYHYQCVGFNENVTSLKLPFVCPVCRPKDKMNRVKSTQSTKGIGKTKAVGIRIQLKVLKVVVVTTMVTVNTSD